MLQRAVVIGGSIAGLCAARVLSDFFEEVLVLERDALDGSTRKGVPQYPHSHVLLAEGVHQLTHLFPELEGLLVQQGAHKTDIGQYARWYQWGGWKCNFPMHIHAFSCSRALLEHSLRTLVEQLPNVKLLSGHKVTGLLSQTQAHTSTICGLQVQTPLGEQDFTTQLVVDASGRGSRVLKWLADLNADLPATSEIPAHVGYVSCRYQMPEHDPLNGQALIISPSAPSQTRAGLALPIENHQWAVTVAGWCSDHPEATHDGILKFAQSLPTPELYQLLQVAQPITQPVRHLIPSSVRKHFERLHRFPKGLLVMGDALCSFNPTYGQGITVAALEAHHLHDCLSESQGDLRDLWRWFFRRIHPVVQAAWDTVKLEDSRYFPDHPLSFTQRLVQKYLVRLHRAATRNVRVSKGFYRVLNMLDPPQALFHPAVLWGVMLQGQPLESPNREAYQRSSRL